MIGRVIRNYPLAYDAMPEAFAEQFNEIEQAREGYSPLNGGLITAGTHHGVTTVAAGSNGGGITTIATWGAGFGGNGNLKVASIPGTLGASGQVAVATNSAQGWAVIAYTSNNGTDTLSGCTLVAGSGTVATGNSVVQATLKINSGGADFDGLLTTWAATDNIPFLDGISSNLGTPILNVNPLWVVVQVTSSGSLTLVAGTAAVAPNTPVMPDAATLNTGNIGYAWVYIPGNATLIDDNTNFSTSNGRAKLWDARAMERRSASGWVSDSNTWAFSSATAFTISSTTDYTSRFTIGTKVRWTDGGGVKYGYVLSSAFTGGNTTTVNLVTNSNYSMANSLVAGTFFFCNSGTKPSDFPGHFTYAPGQPGGTSGGAIGTAAFSIIGNICHVQLASNTLSNYTIASTGGVQVTVSLPVTPGYGTTTGAGGPIVATYRFNDQGTLGIGLAITGSNVSTVQLANASGGVFTNTHVFAFAVDFSYPIS